MVEVSELESSQGIPGLGEHSGFPAWLTLLQNHEHKTQEMLISFNSEADRFGLIEVISPIISNVSNYLNIFFSNYVQSASLDGKLSISTKAILVKIHYMGRKISLNMQNMETF